MSVQFSSPLKSQYQWIWCSALVESPSNFPASMCLCPASGLPLHTCPIAAILPQDGVPDRVSPGAADLENWQVWHPYPHPPTPTSSLTCSKCVCPSPRARTSRVIDFLFSPTQLLSDPRQPFTFFPCLLIQFTWFVPWPNLLPILSAPFSLWTFWFTSSAKPQPSIDLLHPKPRLLSHAGGNHPPWRLHTHGLWLRQGPQPRAWSKSSRIHWTIRVSQFLVLPQFRFAHIVPRKLLHEVQRACFDAFLFLSLFTMMEKYSRNKLTWNVSWF